LTAGGAWRSGRSSEPGAAPPGALGAGARGPGAALYPHRTRMRPPVVQRQTAPRSGRLLFFRRVGLGAVGLRVRALTAFPSRRSRRPMSAPTTACGALAMALESAETPEPLRPRTIAVPSYRPPHPGGGTFAVRQCASGSGEGQPTSSLVMNHPAESDSGSYLANAPAKQVF
jgi:hypothetical protein